MQYGLAVADSEGGHYYVDIDVDEWDPFADVFSLVAHQGQAAAHEALQRESCFLSQAEAADVLVWLRVCCGQVSHFSLLRDVT